MSELDDDSKIYPYSATERTNARGGCGSGGGGGGGG